MKPQPIGRKSTADAAVSSRQPDTGCAGLPLGRIAQLAAMACSVPFACIAVADAGEFWYTPDGPLRDGATAQNPLVFPDAPSRQPLEIPDLDADARLRGRALSIDGIAIRSLAGCAVRGADGELLGVLWIYGRETGALSGNQRTALQLLAEQSGTHMALHARLSELALLAAPQQSSAPVLTEPAPALALIESAPVAVYHTDADGNMTYSNPEYRRMFGLSIGHGPDAWSARVHPEDRVRMEHAWARFCRRPEPSRFDSYRAQADDGSVRHFSEQVVPAVGVVGWVGTISDFTDLVAARDDLRRAETLFSSTFDQAPIGIAYTDRNGELLRFNHSFCRMLGYDAAEIAVRGLPSLTYADDAGRVNAELERLWSGAIEIADLEKRYLRKDGSILWVRMTAALIRERGGDGEYAVEFLRDITASKESAEELERVHKQLMTASRQAGMAEVATNVLHNVGNILNSVNISASLVAERVKQSKAPGIARVAALLREQGTAVGDFIAHDERGKRIPEYLASLGEALANDQRVSLEELASLRDNLEHIKDTVAMQQSYAKLCGVTETIAVVDLVEDSLRLNAGAFVRHGVTLRREFSEVAPITVDKHKVLQILVNLVRNAKYACDESGRPDKFITLRIEPAERGVRICVADNGVGIAAENMPRLFTHGFTTRASGHGFGLHSGALAAQELGGTLRVTSDGPGCGATFILELPFSPAEVDDG